MRHRGEGEEDRDYVTVGFGHWEVTPAQAVKGRSGGGIIERL